MEIISYVLDGLVVILALVALFHGYKKGFFELFLVKFKKIAALVASIFLSKIVAPLLDTLFVQGLVNDFVSSKLQIDVSSVTTADELVALIPEKIATIANMLKIDLHAIAEEVMAKGGDLAKDFITSLISPISLVISYIISFILLFFVTLIVIKLLVTICKGIWSLPVLKQVNGILGFLFLVVLYSVVLYFIGKGILWVQSKNFIPALSEWDVNSGFIFKYIANFDFLQYIMS